MKDITMIIQNTSLMNQAVLPAARTSDAAAPVSTEPEAVAAAPANPVPQRPSTEELNSAVATLNKAMQQANQNLEFSVDTDSHKVVVKMVDTSTGQLIRQYPSEKILAISREIEQFQQGLLLKQKA